MTSTLTLTLTLTLKPMRDLPTTLILIMLTLVALGGSVGAIRRLRRADAQPPVFGAAAWCALIASALFVYRWVQVHPDWQPLESHVDGLILIAAMLAAATYYLSGESRMPGIAAFAMPLLTVLIAWAVCASSFTFVMFEAGSVVKFAHLAGVYLGTLFLAIAAMAGGMYLFLQGRARRKIDFTVNDRLPSLEAAERLIVRSSSLGFALLTVGLITGLIIVITQPGGQMGEGWWYHPKVLLAASVWVIYALVMNVRHATRFRGSRAAWMSIAGFVLLLATLAVSQTLTGSAARGHDAMPDGTPDVTPQTEATP